jgi:hypothetical protein
MIVPTISARSVGGQFGIPIGYLGAFPVPDNDTICMLPLALSVIVRVPV